MSKGRFIQNIAFRFLTHFILRIRGLLLIPIIARLLGVYEYGIWTQLNITILLLIPILTLKLDVSAARYLTSNSTHRHLSQVILSILTLTAIVCLAFTVIGFIFREQLAIFILGSSSHVVHLTPFLLLVPVVTLRQLAMSYYWIFSRIVRYSILELLESLGLVVTVATVAILFATNLTTILWVLIAFEAIIGGYLFLSIMRELDLRTPRLSLLTPYLKYSIPLIPSGILMWVIYFGDRYVITHFLGLESVATYAVAYALGSITAFALAPVAFVLFPHISDLWNKGETDHVRAYLQRSVQYFLMMAIPAAVGIVSLTPRLLHLLAGTAIVAPTFLVPLISAGAVLHGIYQLFMYVLHLSERTRLIFFWVLLAAAANLILNVVFVPIFGMGAAAATTFISYLMLAVAMALHSRPLSIRLNWELLGKIIASTATMGAVIAVARLVLSSLPFLLLLGLMAYLLMLLILKGIGQTELQLVKAIFNKPPEDESGQRASRPI